VEYTQNNVTMLANLLSKSGESQENRVGIVYGYLLRSQLKLLGAVPLQHLATKFQPTVGLRQLAMVSTSNLELVKQELELFPNPTKTLSACLQGVSWDPREVGQLNPIPSSVWEPLSQLGVLDITTLYDECRKAIIPASQLRLKYPAGMVTRRHMKSLNALTTMLNTGWECSAGDLASTGEDLPLQARRVHPQYAHLLQTKPPSMPQCFDAEDSQALQQLARDLEQQEAAQQEDQEGPPSGVQDQPQQEAGQHPPGTPGQ
jgi:hypothetical protein